MKYRPEIDGLRAIAVAPVILFHAGFSLFSGGFVGVDIFFVISGYLITTLICNELATGNFSIIRFYERRARRILPALFTVMLACLPFAWFWIFPEELKNFGKSLVAVTLFSSNLLFWMQTGYFSPSNEEIPLLHTWSLAVEEQYYVLFPLLLLLVWRLGFRRVLQILSVIALGSFLLAQWGGNLTPSYPYHYPHWAWSSVPNWGYYLIPARAWELLIGALTALVLLRDAGTTTPSPSSLHDWLSGLGLGAIAISVVFFTKEMPYPSVYTALPTLGAAAIIAFGHKGTWAHRVLSNKLAVGVGLISYSAYLWHQPLFAFARIRSMTPPGEVTYGLLIASTFFLAYLTWKYIENPFRNRSLVPARNILAGSLIFSTLFISIGMILFVTRGLPTRVSARVAALDAMEMDYRQQRDGNGCNDSTSRLVLKQCVFGDPKVAPTIAVYGDSHAAAIVKELGIAMQKARLSFVQFSKNGCPPIRNLIDPINRDNCDKFNSSVHDLLIKNPAITTIVLVARWPWYLEQSGFNNEEGGEDGKNLTIVPSALLGDPLSPSARGHAVAALLTSDILDLLRHGKKVVLVYPTPEVGWNVPKYLAKEVRWGETNALPDLSTSYQVFKKRNKFTYEVLDGLGTLPSLERVYPAATFCDTWIAGRCVASRGDTSYYYDGDHLSNDGAAFVAPLIVDAVERLRATGHQVALPDQRGIGTVALNHEQLRVR